MSDRPYVFGIGYGRTGTTSLHEALLRLGWNSLHSHYHAAAIIGANKGTKRLILAKIIPKYNAVSDAPVQHFFKRIDHDYPGSRFILTVRGGNEWYVSAKHWNPRRGERLEEVTRMEAHNSTVRTHFHNRPDDLLELRICDGDGWNRLCPYLGVDIPDVAFPHVNAWVPK